MMDICTLIDEYGELAGVMMGIMITCKEFARLTSLRLDLHQPLAVRIKMKLHLVLCMTCARFNKQLGILRRLAQTVAPGFDDVEFDELLKLSEQTKQKILERTRKN